MVLGFMREFASNSDKKEKDKMAEARALVLKKLSEFIPGKAK